MPKLKTNRGAAKRFRRTKNGAFKRQKAYARHLKASKSPKRLRNLRQATLASPEEEPRLKKLMPYS
ncbi:MAG TPA: 50S ribosomal protein L35 [Candidatus Hydrogenedentes bacterium]|nr:50S ribosomal protein L35 [Candidatus Hydrogenedentota bacterium]